MYKLIFLSINFLIFPLFAIKIAFVKQVVYQDLYCASSTDSIKNIIFSSFKRPGPVALFTRFNTDFYIVDVDNSTECNIWKSKAKNSNDLKRYTELKTQIPNDGKIAGHIFPQGHFSVKCDSIDWKKYDIVITIDTAIPARITLKYPKTLWAYYIGEGIQPEYKASFKKIIKGYDCFLTQNCRSKPKHLSHVIEFPYHLQYFGCFHELFNWKENNIKRNGIYLETHTNIFLNDNQKKILNNISKVVNSGERLSLKEMLLVHLNSKYFIQFVEPESGIRSSTLGNAVIQAIAAGNLVIVKKQNTNNRDVVTEKTLVDTFEDVVNLIEYFEANPDKYKKELKLQRKNLNYLCCNRPMNELLKKAELKKMKYFRYKNL